MKSQTFRAKFYPPIIGQRSHLLCPIHSVYFFRRLNLTKYYANLFPLILATASVEKFQSYLYKVKVQEPGLIHETFNHSFHHRP